MSSLGILSADFVLRGTRKGALRRYVPGLLVVEVLGLGELRHILFDAPAPAVLEIHDPGQLLRVDSVLIVNRAVGVGERDALRAKLVQLFDRVLRHIARPGDQAGLAPEILAARLEHLLAEVDAAISGGFGPDKRSAPGQDLCLSARP